MRAMGLWQRFARFIAEPLAAPLAMTAQPAQKFAIDIPLELIEAMTSQGTIAPRISRDQALQVPAVLRARNLIAGSLGTLPIRVHGPDRRVITSTPYLVPTPDPEIAQSVIIAQTVEDLLFESISWWRVTARNRDNFPVEAHHIPWSSVTVVPTGINRPSGQLISPDQPYPVDGRVFIDGIHVPDREIIRFDSPNPPLLRHAARAIRTCLLLDTAAALYSKDPLPLGYFSPEEGADPASDEEIEEILTDWETARAKRAWGYLKGLKANPLQWNPEQLQLAAQRQHAVLEIARATGVDPEDLGVSTTSRTYANSEQRRQDLIDFTLGAYVSAMQDRLSMRDVLPQGYTARIDFAGFRRGDTITRMNGYKTGLEVGAYADADEIRVLEGSPNLTPAQKKARAAVIAPTEGPAMESDVREELDMEKARREALEAEVLELREAVTKLAALADQMRDAPRSDGVQRFDAADTMQIRFDAADTHDFQVDSERRTVVGLLLPWGKVANNGMGKWRFTEGSVTWSEVSRIKLNLHHDSHDLIGVATRLQSASRGLMGTFRVGRGPEGDRALQRAEDGILDGFSVEVAFEDLDSWQPDPTDESVRLVNHAQLRGVAMTGTPAFDDARLTGVHATRQGSSTMGDNARTATVAGAAAGATPDGPDLNAFMTDLTAKMAESHKAATAGLAESFGSAISDGVKAALENLSMPQTDGPQPVRAARWAVTHEPPVYAFAGVGHSLVRDAYHAVHQNDRDALARLRKYHEQTAEMAKLATAQLAMAHFAPQSTATAPQIIPPGYRPDLYVSELLRGRPLVDACSRGTIDNASPFTVPVFTSSTGVTADHVEGTNPADGSIAFATKTVTPGGISGRLVLTREIVDSSNPAIDQIALATMRESYARQTEAKVYTLLNGANGAGGVITGDFVPSGAQASTVASASLPAHIRARLAKYPFNRFAPPGIALMGQNATTLLATAVGTDGRPLFPSVGATNPAGLGNAITQGWFVDGLAFVPAWAMTGTAAGDSQIMMLNQADAWVWESPLLTFQFNEKLGPANIELNVFGYFGTHLLRPVGLSGIRIT